jgi:hypothetical protein
MVARVPGGDDRSMPMNGSADADPVQVFDAGDEPYLAWLHAHPQGFVLSLSRDGSGAVAVVHQAVCGTIRKYSQAVRRGDFTTRGVVKICCDSVAPLLAYARESGGRPDGSPGQRCRSCNPWSPRAAVPAPRRR